MTDVQITPDVQAATAETPEKPEEPSNKRMPQKFWQWLFIYPTFGLALLSATPQWVTSAREFMMELQGRPLEEALKQRAIFSANLECLQAPFIWHQTGTGLEVDATMCPQTADLLLRFKSEDGQQSMYGIDIDAIGPKAADAGGWFVSAAYADQAPAPISADDAATYLLAQATRSIAIVQCVSQIDDRTILRHVRVGAECYDERLDTLTGQITAQIPTPCRPSC